MYSRPGLTGRLLHYAFVCLLPNYTSSEPLTPAYEMDRQLDFQPKGKALSLSSTQNLMLGDKGNKKIIKEN